MKDAVSVVKVLLDSGHKTLIRSSENVIEHMKKIKALDWKVCKVSWFVGWLFRA